VNISLGRCHFGGEDAATMTAVRAAGAGWVAVCERHRERAEADGFVVRAPTPVLAEAAPAPSRDQDPEPVQPEPAPVHDPAPEVEAEAPSERRVVVGALSLGRCHYGCAVATMTGARQGASGWIAVCADHLTRAEADGYVVREVAGVTIAPPMYDEAHHIEAIPVPTAAPTAALPAFVDTLRRALEPEADDDDSGLDIFGEMLDGP
jgi:hypothetical protein